LTGDNHQLVKNALHQQHLSVQSYLVVA